MKALSIFLIAFSFLVLFFGFSVSTGAPQQTVFVGFACFFGILARIAQSSGQHKELMNNK